MIEPMDIDDRLEGIEAERAFVLGVEWSMVRQIAQTGEDIHTRPIHTDNARRIEKMLARHGYYQVWDHRDDWSFVTASTSAPE